MSLLAEDVALKSHPMNHITPLTFRTSKVVQDSILYAYNTDNFIVIEIFIPSTRRIY